jgi:PmbA protein
LQEVSIQVSRQEFTDDSQGRLDRLAQLAGDVLAEARAQGASAAEVGLSEDEGLAVNVRLGEVETVEHSRDRALGLTVYLGQRKAHASSADFSPEAIRATVEQALAIARHTEPDEASGLADPELMAREFPDLDLWHPWALDAESAIEIGIRCEDAGRADARISNSEGAGVHSGASLAVYANSHGFLGRERGTRHSLSCSLLAGRGEGMQRDYWYSSARAVDDLESAEQVGRQAAARTVRRLDSRSLSTRECPVIFAAEMARGLVGHLASAVSGGALYRKASFLQDALDTQVLPGFVHMVERPHLRRGPGSANFDAEGVATREQVLIEGGVLKRYVLASYSARKLGLTTTGNAGGLHNLIVAPGEDDLDALLARMGSGLLVTELMGQGVNTVTGDYSRGAAGFWVENGVIVHAVDGVTIAGQLRDMFRGIQAIGRDVDTRSGIQTGSILIDRMTVAGD